MPLRRMAPRDVEPSHMLPSLAPDLERQLLRRGVGRLVAHRPQCRDCRRTPLAGELVHVYGDERMVCSLCRSQRREAPVRSEVLRSSEHGHAVRIRDQRAA